MAFSLGMNSPRLAHRKLFKERHHDQHRVTEAERPDVLNHSFQLETLDEGSNRSPKCESKAEHRENTIFTMADSDKFCSDPFKKRKILQTVLLLIIYATAGLIYGQMGPTLPDLQRISGVQLEKASWIFTGFALGYLLGCLLGGILLENFNPYLLLFLYSIGVAITTALLPWIPELVVMVILRVGTGFGIGGQDTGIHTMLLYIWQNEGGRFIHVTHIQAAVGGVLSPLITEPFVTSKPIEKITTELTSNLTLAGYNGSFSINTTNADPDANSFIQDQESTIHYAFLITAILTAVPAFPSLYFYFIDKGINDKLDDLDEEETRKSDLPTKVKMVVFGILCVNSFLTTACFDLFPSFLTTFLIENLNWAQTTGTVLTSIYFGTYGLGNLIAAFTHSYLQTTILIIVSYAATLATLVMLLLSVVYRQTVLIWVSVSVTGFTASVLLPTLFSWTQEYITPVTGRIASALLFSGSAGVIANPLLLGYLMDNFTPMWFLYCSLGECLLCGVLFAFAYGLFKLYSRPVRTGTSDTNQDASCNSNAKNASNGDTPTSEVYTIHL